MPFSSALHTWQPVAFCAVYGIDAHRCAHHQVLHSEPAVSMVPYERSTKDSLPGSPGVTCRGGVSSQEVDVKGHPSQSSTPRWNCWVSFLFRARFPPWSTSTVRIRRDMPRVGAKNPPTARPLFQAQRTLAGGPCLTTRTQRTTNNDPGFDPTPMYEDVGRYEVVLVM